MVSHSAQNEVFSAISAPARREMLRLLATRDTPVSEMAESFEMSLSAVSQHLSILKDAGLVIQMKAGRQRIYRLNPEPLQAVSDWLSFYEPFWKQRLAELGSYLDETQ